MTATPSQRARARRTLIVCCLLILFVTASPFAVKGAEAVLPLSEEERDYLDRKGAITYCLHPDRMPFSAIEDGRPSGMAVDLVDQLERRLDIPFRFVPTDGWRMSLAYIESGGCDILPMVDIPSSPPNYLLFTPPFFQYTPAIVTRTPIPFITSLRDLGNRTIGIVENDPIQTSVIDHFPRIPFTLVSTPRAGLSKVSSGYLDALVITTPVAVYYIRRFGLTDLRIAGQVDLLKKIGIGVGAESDTLRSILIKATAAIEDEEVEEIYRKQIAVRPDRRIDYRLLILMVLGAAVAGGLAVLWHRKLVRFKKQLATTRAELAAKEDQIQQMANTDPLTCLNNRMRLIDILSKEAQRFRRYGNPTSIIFSDVDHFKDINETFGYNLGDVVLCKMGQTLEESIRKADICGRWGGEKFMVICPETEMEGALILAEHLRKRIESLSLPKVGHRTCSLGVASFLPDDTEESIVQRADHSQNLAKEKGGNRVEAAE